MANDLLLDAIRWEESVRAQMGDHSFQFINRPLSHYSLKHIDQENWVNDGEMMLARLKGRCWYFQTKAFRDASMTTDVIRHAAAGEIDAFAGFRGGSSVGKWAENMERGETQAVILSFDSRATNVEANSFLSIRETIEHLDEELFISEFDRDEAIHAGHYVNVTKITPGGHIIKNYASSLTAIIAPLHTTSN